MLCEMSGCRVEELAHATNGNPSDHTRQFNDVLSPAPPGILSIRSVAVELRHAIDRMQRRNSWPRFLLESKDKGPAQQLSSEEGYFETGNLVWENLYWLGGRLPTGTGIVADVERNARVPTDEYGTGSNKSSKGILMLTATPLKACSAGCSGRF